VAGGGIVSGRFLLLCGSGLTLLVMAWLLSLLLAEASCFAWSSGFLIFVVGSSLSSCWQWHLVVFVSNSMVVVVIIGDGLLFLVIGSLSLLAVAWLLSSLLVAASCCFCQQLWHASCCLCQWWQLGVIFVVISTLVCCWHC